MPFLWVWQSIAYPIKKICAGSLKRDVRSEHSTMTRVSERRIAMFKALGMLE